MDKSFILRLFSKKKSFLLFFFLLLIIAITRFIGKNETKTRTHITPIWHGITPNQTTKQEVIKLMGQPNNIIQCKIQLEDWFVDSKRCFNGYLIFQYREIQSNNRVATHEIHFLSDKVWFIVEDVLPNSNNKQIYLEKFVKQHGVPEEVTWSKVSIYFNAVLFCNYGVIIHANDSFAKVYYFEPMSHEKCLQEFSKEVSINNPFPDSDVIGVKDPWKFDRNYSQP